MGSSEDLIKFNRIKPLVFLVDFKGESAGKHKFIYSFIEALFQRKYTGDKTNNMTTQDKLIWLLKNIKISEFTKEIRCHILFSDIILVRRHLPDKINYELIFGVPTLLRIGLIDENDLAIKSMRL
jgi:hypothetical protein